MGNSIMNPRKFLYDVESGWCGSAHLYFERFVPDSVTTVRALERFILNDTEYATRVAALHVELGTTFEITDRRRAFATVRAKKQREGVIQRCGDLVGSDEYRLINQGSNVIYKGKLADIETLQTVEYDDAQWWFARGIDGTLLNNEEEVLEYNGSIVRQRQYHDAVDNLSVWLEE